MISKSFEESLKFWRENPDLVDTYLKALGDERKKPVAEQRPEHKIALECVQAYKEKK